MEIITSLPFPVLRNSNKTVGFVPTMGYLHAGHLSLIQRAKYECDVVVLSIFVNPLQFGPNEDYEKYPRHTERDLRLAREAAVDYVFLPDVNVMYPKPLLTKVNVTGITEQLCGSSRPGHFDGVATVVLKLLNIVQPYRAYFGLKDAQQFAVIQQMVDDLNVPVTVVPCPTLREADGLAMSSRNVYLSAAERQDALVLHQVLQTAEQMIREGRITCKMLKEHIIAKIGDVKSAQIDYVEIKTYPALAEIEEQSNINQILSESAVIVALAVKFGATRLIDNVILHK